MRVLHVIESMARGGAERNMASLLGPLTVLGVENHLVTLFPGRSYEDRVAPFVKRYEFNVTSRRSFKALPGLVRLAREVDVVHTQLTWANILGRVAAVAARRPSVTTLHTTAYDEANLARLPASLRFPTRVVRQLDAATGRATRHFFAVSPIVKDVNARTLRIAPNRIEVAPVCFDPKEFDPELVGDRSAVRAALGWAPDEFVVLSVGRLIASKRQCDAIDAVAGAARHTRMRLCLAGSGPEEAALRAQTQRLQAPVTFLGVRDDVPRLLRAADIFIFPSEHEGMPVALLEAMAMGLPCLCSDIVENRTVGGEAASYFPLGDVASIGRSLVALAGNRCRLEEMGHAHRIRALHYADPMAAATRFVRSVQAVLENRLPEHVPA